MNTRATIVAVAGAAALSISAPAVADAATTRWVKPGGLTSGECTTIASACRYDRALNAGGPTAAGDSVVFLAGTYDVSAAEIVVTKKLDISGLALGDRPVITGGDANSITFKLDAAAGGSTVRHVDIRATGDGGRGILAAGSVALRDIAATASGTCLQLGGGYSTIEDSSAIHSKGASGGSVCVAATQSHTTLSNFTVLDFNQAATALLFGGPGSSADRLYVASSGNGVALEGGTGGQRATIRRARLGAGALPLLTRGGKALVTDSFLRTSAAATPALFADYGADVELRGVTANARGAGSWALRVGSAPPGQPVKLKARGVIARGVAGGLQIVPGGPDPLCGAMNPCSFPDHVPGSALVSYSNLNSSSATVVDQGHNQSGDPKFLNPAANDYRIAADSPAIDAGIADPLNGPTDFYGSARTLGAAPDIGAFERDPAVAADPPPDSMPGSGGDTPADVPGGGGATGGGGGPGGGGGGPIVTDSIAPALSSVSLTPKRFAVAGAPTPVAARAARGTVLSYTLSEPATVAIGIEQRTSGRRTGNQCVKPTRKLRRAKRCTRYLAKGSLTRMGAGGAATVAFSGRIGKVALKPGRYRASLIASDAAGNRSRVALVTFTVVRR